MKYSVASAEFGNCQAANVHGLPSLSSQLHEVESLTVSTSRIPLAIGIPTPQFDAAAGTSEDSDSRDGEVDGGVSVDGVGLGFVGLGFVGLGFVGLGFVVGDDSGAEVPEQAPKRRAAIGMSPAVIAHDAL